MFVQMKFPILENNSFSIELLRLLFDSGLLVLIWLVQLVIYPSFKFYEKENLLKWHKQYTTGISCVVIPLMFGQLITAILQCIDRQDFYTIGSMILIVFVWVITFTQFVPIHNKIADAQTDKTLLIRLVQRNWYRTALWSIIFLSTLITSLLKTCIL